MNAGEILYQWVDCRFTKKNCTRVYCIFFIFCLMFSQAMFMSSPSLKFSKASSLFLISVWYCFLTSSSFNFLRLNHSPSNFCAISLITASLSLTYATTRQWSVSHSAPLKLRTSSILECRLLPINIWSIQLWVLPSEEIWLYLRLFRCKNIALLTTRFFNVAKLTTLTPLSFASWYRLPLRIVGLKIFSLPNFSPKSPNRIFVCYLEK
jgi:hypothetical protein